jgi:glycosyltransferase involved in cell wall biosynthesis
LAAAGIPITIIGKRSKLDLMSFFRLRKELKRLQPDVLHTWLFAGNSYGRLCAGAIPHARIVVSERCVDSWKSPWQLWLDRRLIERTDRLVGNSSAVVTFYRDLGVPLDKMTCVPNGIDLPKVGGANSDRASLLRELGLPEGSYVIGYIGRLAKQKRVEDLIWATETLRQVRDQIRLVLIGDGPERIQLEQFAHDVHCQNHVRFLGHRDDAARFLPAFDVFCLASSFEGMSNSIMEAMATGLPVVASDIPPNRELVVQNETGFLCQLADTVGFMQCLRRLIDEPGLGPRLGEAGRQRIETQFSVSRMVDAYASLYQALVEH